MSCFKLKDKHHLQKRNECLAETAACCKLEPALGAGGTPGEWSMWGWAECCPLPAPPCSTSLLVSPALRSSCFYCMWSELPVSDLKPFVCLFPWQMLMLMVHYREKKNNLHFSPSFVCLSSNSRSQISTTPKSCLLAKCHSHSWGQQKPSYLSVKCEGSSPHDQ